jgi:hypothetical protein
MNRPRSVPIAQNSTYISQNYSAANLATLVPSGPLSAVGAFPTQAVVTELTFDTGTGVAEQLNISAM